MDDCPGENTRSIYSEILGLLTIGKQIHQSAVTWGFVSACFFEWQKLLWDKVILGHTQQDVGGQGEMFLQ